MTNNIALYVSLGCNAVCEGVGRDKSVVATTMKIDKLIGYEHFTIGVSCSYYLCFEHTLYIS